MGLRRERGLLVGIALGIVVLLFVPWDIYAFLAWHESYGIAHDAIMLAVALIFIVIDEHLSDFTYRAWLRQQLARLQELKGWHHDEASADESRWEQLTESIVERTFGKPSTNLANFYTARSTGSFYFGEMSDGELQDNFSRRIQAFDAFLQSTIEQIEIFLSGAEIKGAYDPGDEYAIYRDLSVIIESATIEVLIVDAYLDEKPFNLYVEKVAPHVAVRTLTNKVGSNVEAVAKMFASRRTLELRASPTVHDRVLFLDKRGWVIGQSLKDAKAKPTYLVELTEPALGALHRRRKRS
jgi:hypothetical protein